MLTENTLLIGLSARKLSQQPYQKVRSRLRTLCQLNRTTVVKQDPVTGRTFAKRENFKGTQWFLLLS